MYKNISLLAVASLAMLAAAKTQKFHIVDGDKLDAMETNGTSFLMSRD